MATLPELGPTNLLSRETMLQYPYGAKEIDRIIRSSHTLRLCDRHGLTWEIARSWRGPVWTGDRFIFDLDQWRREHGWFHELAHWCFADDWQRDLPDFGLGWQPDGLGEWRSSTWRRKPAEWVDAGIMPSWSDEPRLHRDDADRQETFATLAIGLLACFGEPFGDLRQTLDDFNTWYEGSRWRWESDHSREVAEVMAPICGISTSKAFRTLERFRKAGPP